MKIKKQDGERESLSISLPPSLSIYLSVSFSSLSLRLESEGEGEQRRDNGLKRYIQRKEDRTEGCLYASKNGSVYNGRTAIFKYSDLKF